MAGCGVVEVPGPGDEKVLAEISNFWQGKTAGL